MLEQPARQAAIDLARRVILASLSGEPLPSAESAGLPEVNAGCFVSLHETNTHRLRGCIGTLSADQPLATAVHNAATGVLSDPRFVDDQVRLDQAANLVLELSVIGPLEPEPDADRFDLSRGIALSVGDRRGCFLPQVAAETGWSRRQLLERLCVEKLRLAADAWRWPEAVAETFAVEVIGPEPLAAGGGGGLTRPADSGLGQA